MSKDRKCPICHRVTDHENLAPANETFQFSALLKLKPVVLVPVITGLASSGGREKMFALSLPAVKSFKSGLPTSLHLRFLFTGGVMGGYCLADVSSVFIFYHPIQADCRVPRHTGEEFELFTLVHCVRLFWWYFFLHLYYGKLLSEGRNSLCSQHFQGPRGVVTCYWGGSHAQIHRTEKFSFFITHSTSAGSNMAGANSRALTPGQSLNWNPWLVTSHFVTSAVYSH